jgi:hypothetical protein
VWAFASVLRSGSDALPIFGTRKSPVKKTRPAASGLRFLASSGLDWLADIDQERVPARLAGDQVGVGEPVGAHRAVYDHARESHSAFGRRSFTHLGATLRRNDGDHKKLSTAKGERAVRVA